MNIWYISIINKFSINFRLTFPNLSLSCVITTSSFFYVPFHTKTFTIYKLSILSLLSRDYYLYYHVCIKSTSQILSWSLLLFPFHSFQVSFFFLTSVSGPDLTVYYILYNYGRKTINLLESKKKTILTRTALFLINNLISRG